MYSQDLKTRVVQLYQNIGSLRKVSQLINVSKSTIHRWVCGIFNKRVNDAHNIERMIDIIKTKVKKNPFVTINCIRNSITKQLSVTYSRSFIHTVMVRTMNLSYKKASKVNIPSNKQRLVAHQRSYYRKIRQLNKKDIIYVDETGFYSTMVPVYGWGTKGEPLIVKQKLGNKKVSMIMAISHRRILLAKKCTSSVNQVVFADFMRELLKDRTGKTIVMDNVAFHKTRMVRDIVCANNHLLFTPPYSPWCNPIEEVFGTIKNHVRQSKRKNIMDAINISMKKIKHLSNYYNHSLEVQRDHLRH
jgi:transposase